MRESSGESGRAQSFGNFTEAVLILGIILSVLAFGGTEPTLFAAVEVLFFGTSALQIAIRKNWAKNVPPLSFVIPAGLCTVVLLQLFPWLDSFGRLADRFLGVSVSHTAGASIEPYATRTHFLMLLTCLIGFYLVQIVAQDRIRMRRLINVLIGLGVFEALYGLVQYLTRWQRIFTYVKKYDLAEATGTYINRNHYAGFLEMILPLSLAFVFYEVAKLRRRQTEPMVSLKKVLARSGLQRIVFYLFIAVLLFAALIFSRSRMGIVAAAASSVVVFFLAAALKRQARMGLVLSVPFVLLVSCFAIWIGPGPIAARFENVSQEYSQHDQSRLSIWQGTWTLIRERPLLGTGLGTFPIAFTGVQTTFLGEFVNHAHNDYLEFASDIGLPAALALFASIIYLLVRAVRNAFQAENRFDRAVALGCSGSILAILLHSLTDFNLHIPANALLFSTVLGLSLVIRPARENTAEVIG